MAARRRSRAAPSCTAATASGRCGGRPEAPCGDDRRASPLRCSAPQLTTLRHADDLRGSRHAPPHIHAQGQGGTVEIVLEPLSLRAVRGRLTDSQVRAVVRIARERHVELLRAWRTHHG
ncbi:MAG: DUF4160 domain-containing protein [Burkholderiales bacterium]|nr:DUF4160 domain-containing protein [Burkholderiales bacterium]